MAWIRDDAVNEGDKLNPQYFKTIVTGEPINIDRKNKSAVRVALVIPVVLTANALPAARDASDAVFNRSLVIDMTRVFDEATAITLRQELGVPAGLWLGDWLFAQEGPGLLNWALEGLSRLLKRGGYEIPEAVAGAIQDFKDQGSAVSQFARTMLEASGNTKIARADVLCAFHGWLKEEDGDGTRLHGARWLMPKLRIACPKVVFHQIGARRYLCGVKLTDAALLHWQNQKSDADQRARGAKGASALSKDVNQPWSPLKPNE